MGEIPVFLQRHQKKLQKIENRLQDTEDNKHIIQTLLVELLQFYDADRAYVIEGDWKKCIGAITYEAAAEDVVPHCKYIHYLPYTLFPHWLSYLDNKKPLIVNNIAEIQDKMPKAYYLLERQNIQSLIIAPFSKRFNKGFVVVDNPKQHTDDIGYLMLFTYAVVSELNEIRLLERIDTIKKQFTQHPESEIYISCFGGLEIRRHKGVITDDVVTGDQCYQLLIYLIMNRKRVRPVRELAEMLWPEEAIEDPYHDVKNVVYRLKKFLAHAELDDLVVGSSGTFILNPKYKILTDFERFEDNCNHFFDTDSQELKEMDFQNAQALYKGMLFPRSEHTYWLMPMITYYQNLYLKLMKMQIQRKMSEKDYFTAQKIAMDGLVIEPYDTDFKVVMLMCMYEEGNSSIAGVYYSKIESELTDEQKMLIEKYRS